VLKLSVTTVKAVSRASIKQDTAEIDTVALVSRLEDKYTQ